MYHLFVALYFDFSLQASLGFRFLLEKYAMDYMLVVQFLDFHKWLAIHLMWQLLSESNDRWLLNRLR